MCNIIVQPHEHMSILDSNIVQTADDTACRAFDHLHSIVKNTAIGIKSIMDKLNHNQSSYNKHIHVTHEFKIVLVLDALKDPRFLPTMKLNASNNDELFSDVDALYEFLLEKIKYVLCDYMALVCINVKIADMEFKFTDDM